MNEAHFLMLLYVTIYVYTLKVHEIFFAKKYCYSNNDGNIVMTNWKRLITKFTERLPILSANK